MTTRDRAAGVVVRHLSTALDLPSSDITLDAQLTHLENASSLRLLDAVAAVEDELAVEIDMDELVRVKSVADFVRLVEASAGSRGIAGDRPGPAAAPATEVAFSAPGGSVHLDVATHSGTWNSGHSHRPTRLRARSKHVGCRGDGEED